MQDFDVQQYRDNKKVIEAKKERLSDLIDEMSRLSDDKTRNQKKYDLLSEVPCGNKYPTCKFIKDAHSAGDLIQVVESKMQADALEINQIGEDLQNLDPTKTDDHLNKYNLLLEMQRM